MRRYLVDEVSVTAPARVLFPMLSDLKVWHRQARDAGFAELAALLDELITSIRIYRAGVDQERRAALMADELVEVPGSGSAQGSTPGTGGNLDRMTARQAADATGKTREYICRLARDHVIAGDRDERGTWSLIRSSVEAYMHRKAS